MTVLSWYCESRYLKKKLSISEQDAVEHRALTAKRTLRQEIGYENVIIKDSHIWLLRINRVSYKVRLALNRGVLWCKPKSKHLDCFSSKMDCLHWISYCEAFCVGHYLVHWTIKRWTWPAHKLGSRDISDLVGPTCSSAPFAGSAN